MAIEKHPSYLRAYANLGFVLMEIGEHERALPVLLKSVELGANESQIYGLIGFVYSNAGLYESALVAYRLAIFLNPTSREWRKGVLSCLIDMERNEEALNVLDEMIAFEYDNSTKWIQRASILFELGEKDSAIANTQVAHLLGGESFKSQLFLGNMLYEKMHYSSAVDAFIRSGEISELSLIHI